MKARPPALAGSQGREEAAVFLARVGENVRARREAAGLTRRQLAERSGLSERYLATLEAGRGNISIALLYRVALALGAEVAELVARPDPASAPAGRFALLGLRGAGKSTLGRRAGERLGLPFLELSEVVEEANGIPAGEAISLYGEAGYRASEREAIARIVKRHPQVILAVGGGVVEHRESFALLLRHFHTIWIRARPEEHMERVRAQGDIRPMAGISNAMARLRAILASREPLYSQAQSRIDTSGKSPAESLQELIATLQQAPPPRFSCQNPPPRRSESA